MVYFEETKFCHNCGRAGFITSTCPSCIRCVYCKTRGHLVSECPRVPPCISCGKKGHRPDRCPVLNNPPQMAQSYKKRKRSRSNEPTITNDENRLDLCEESQSCVILAINPPQHDSLEWFEIDTRELAFPQPLYTLPDLKSLCVKFLQLIAEGLVYDPDKKFATFIQSQGDAATLAAQLYEDIDPYIKDLQGSWITGEALMKVARDQIADHWWLDDRNIGYCDFIIDDRKSEFLRIYVGQAVNARKRVLSDHIASILRNENDTLHYFMIWIGNGHRSANFLRLWCFGPETDTDQTLPLRMNLLEALFCYAFNSCHGLFLTKCESEVYTNTSCFGLNVMSPLLQDFLKPTNEHKKCIQAVLRCPDSQVVEFIYSRNKRKLALQQVSQGPLWSETQYWRSLEEALGDTDYFQKVRTMLDRPKKPIGPLPDEMNDYPYFGSMSAPVGLVLDHAIQFLRQSEVSSTHETDQTARGVFSRLSQTLKKTGFDEDNVLAWTFDLKPLHNVEASITSTLGQSQQAIIRTKHDQMLKLSQSKVVLLCGVFSQRTITSMVKCRKYTLKLRGASYTLYLSMDNVGQCRRIFISCPHIPIRVMASTAKNAAIICEAFKFTFVVTGLREMWPFTLLNSSALKQICVRRAQEKISGDMMTIENMDPEIRDWLRRKGFDDITEIQKLEQIAGSLTKGLLALCRCLPRGFKDRVNDRLRWHVTGRRTLTVLDSAAMRDAKVFGMEMVARRDEGFKDLRQLDKSAKSAAGSVSPCPSAELFESDRVERIERVAKENASVIDSCIDGYLKNTDIDERASEDLLDLQEDLPAEIERELKSLSLDPSKLNEVEDHWSDVVAQRYTEIGEEEYKTIYEHQTESEMTQMIMEKDEAPDSYKPTRKLREGKRPRWVEEALKFKGKKYAFRLLERENRHIFLCYCNFTIPAKFDIGDGCIDVFMELADVDQRHPESYAISALDEDIGKRLAFRVIITDSHGHKRIWWPKKSTQEVVFKANSCVDKIVNGKQSRDLLNIPRRYIPPLGKSDPNKAFRTGGYTSSTQKQSDTSNQDDEI